MQLTHIFNEVTLRIHCENLFRVIVKGRVDHDFSQGIEARAFQVKWSNKGETQLRLLLLCSWVFPLRQDNLVMTKSLSIQSIGFLPMLILQ